MSIVHTSKTSPLQVATPEGFPDLGMSICPGKVDPYAMSGACARDLATDIASIQQWGARVVITLMENAELSALHVKGLGRAVEKAGMTWWHFAVVDGSAFNMRHKQTTCHFWDLPCAMLRLLLSIGSKVFIHCRGGLGRTGTLAARILIEEGLKPEKAISLIRKARPGAIETQEQEDYLLALPKILDANKKRNIVRAGMLGGAIGDALESSMASLKESNISESDYISHATSIGTLKITENTLLALFTTEALIRAYASPPASCPRMRPLYAKIDKLAKKLGNTESFEANKLRITQAHVHEADANAPQRLKYLYPELCTQYFALRDWRVLQSSISHTDQPEGNGSLFLCRPAQWAALPRDDANTSLLESKTFFPSNSNSDNSSIVRLTPIGLVSKKYVFVSIGDGQYITRTLYGDAASAINEGSFEIGLNSSRLTHGDPVTSLTAGVWVRLVSLLAFDKAPIKERLEALLKDIIRYKCSTSIESSLPQLVHDAFILGRKNYLSKNAKAAIPSELGSGKTAEESLAIALYCTIAHRRYEDALLAVVAHCKDSTGIALLMSQLWGLRHGQKGFPSAFQTSLGVRSTILAAADALTAISYSTEDMRKTVAKLWPDTDFYFLSSPEVESPHHNDTLEGYVKKRFRFSKLRMLPNIPWHQQDLHLLTP